MRRILRLTTKSGPLFPSSNISQALSSLFSHRDRISQPLIHSRSISQPPHILAPQSSSHWPVHRSSESSNNSPSRERAELSMFPMKRYDALAAPLLLEPIFHHSFAAQPRVAFELDLGLFYSRPRGKTRPGTTIFFYYFFLSKARVMPAPRLSQT